MITLYDVPSFKPLLEERWLAVALLYGPPPLIPTEQWHNRVVPLAFRMALEKVFDPAEVERVGLRRMAFDYAEWYIINENNQR